MLGTKFLNPSQHAPEMKKEFDKICEEIDQGFQNLGD